MHRRQKIGTEITRRLLEHAETQITEQAYVSAVPPESAVGIYGSFGFAVIEDLHLELFELEPGDIHVVLELIAQKINSIEHVTFSDSECHGTPIEVNERES